MRRIIGLALAGLLRSRYAVAALLALLVLGAVGVARLAAPPPDDPVGVVTAPKGPITTVHPTVGDDGVVGTPSATRGSGSPTPAVDTAAPRAAARAFADAWLLHRGVTGDQWRAGLRPHATTDLMDRLANTDPARVPAERIVGALTAVAHGATFVEVAVPVDSGRLVLRVLAVEGRWLVDGVDWERA
ncbi:MAG TPA: hypothetical protein VNV66_15775 [Pilimelia sp.]|nr:hypothetical protein [Pilimelia sp.]